jgi:hypothetical protein
MHAVGRVHDLRRHFVFGHVKSKTISRQDAKIAKKTSHKHGDNSRGLGSSKKLEIQFRHLDR